MSGSDAELLRRWIAGRDAEAFGEIVVRHSAMVYATCRRILRDSVLAQDVTQECFLALTQLKKAVADSLAPWLHVVATRRALDVLKRDKRRQAREQHFATTDTSCSNADWEDVQQYVDEAIAELPEKLRAPLIRHFLQGRTHQEVSEELGIPRTTVSSRIAKAVENVRKALERRGVSILGAALTSMLAAEQAQAAPVAVIAALGKLAISGGSAAVVAAPSLIAAGGLALSTKKLIIVAALLVLLVFGGASVLPKLRESGTKPETTADALKQSTTPKVDSGHSVKPPEAPATASTAAETPARPAPVDAPVDETPRNAEKPIPEMAISGIVVDRDGQPVEGAEVVLANRGDVANPAALTTSDSVGSFLLPIDRESKFMHLSASKADLGFAEMTWVPSGSQDIVLRLGSAGGLSGLVLDAVSKEPIAGARIQLIDTLQDGGGPTLMSTADEAGTYAFAGLKIAKSYVVRASNEGYAMGESAAVEMRQATHMQNVDVYLDKGYAIYGAVIDSANRGLAGLTVDLGRPERHLWTVLPGLSAVTQADGTFVMKNVPPGDYLPSVLTAPSTRVKGDAFTMPLKADLRDLIIAVGPAVEGFISGTVRDTKGSPIQRVEVVAYSGAVIGVADTDKEGFYRLGGLGGAESYELEIKGFRTGHGRARESGVPVNSENVDAVLRKSGAARGQVVDAVTGKPIQSFAVRWGEWTWRDFTSDNGEFELTNIEREHVTLEARAPGYAPTKTVAMTIADGQTVEEVIIKLKRGEEAAGIVLDAATGAPLEGARVRPLDSPMLRSEYLRGTAWSSQDPMTDAEGRFELAGLGDQPCVLAWKQGYAPSVIFLADQDASEELVFELSQGASVTGVTSDEGQTLGNCPVVFFRRPTEDTFGYHAFVASTGTGEFELLNLPPGNYSVMAFRTMPSGGNPQPDWLSDIALSENEPNDIVIRFESAGGLDAE